MCERCPGPDEYKRDLKVREDPFTLTSFPSPSVLVRTPADMRASLSFFALALAPGALAATYQLSDNFVGSDFLSSFTHEAIADPTHGRV